MKRQLYIFEWVSVVWLDMVWYCIFSSSNPRLHNFFHSVIHLYESLLWSGSWWIQPSLQTLCTRWEYNPDGITVHHRALWTHSHTLIHTQEQFTNQATYQHVLGTFNMRGNKWKLTRTQEVHVKLHTESSLSLCKLLQFFRIKTLFILEWKPSVVYFSGVIQIASGSPCRPRSLAPSMVLCANITEHCTDVQKWCWCGHSSSWALAEASNLLWLETEGNRRERTDLPSPYWQILFWACCAVL